MNARSFDPTKPVQTRDGRKVELLRHNLNTVYSIVAIITEKDGTETGMFYTEDGEWMKGLEGHKDDLINIPTKHKLTGWVNVYAEHLENCVHKTKIEADKAQSRLDKRIACLDLSQYNILQTLLDKFDDHAGGSPHATDLDKFCNEMIGTYNEVVSLGPIRTLKQQNKELTCQIEMLKEALKIVEKNLRNPMSHGQLEVDYINPALSLTSNQAFAEMTAKLLKPLADALKNELRSHYFGCNCQHHRLLSTLPKELQ